MAEQAWTVRSMLLWAREWLGKKGVENARLDAELLLARALACDRVRLYVDHDKPLSAAELTRFKALIVRRAEREPVAYILGVKEFYGRPFAVDKRAFIPRPETELLVQAALQALQEGGPGPARALDLCAGSGAVGVSLAAEHPALSVDLVELAPDTAEVARANAATHAPGRATVHEGDLYAALPQQVRYRAIVSNPPYVPLRDKAGLAKEIALHEPPLALFGGEDGLSVIRRIVAGAPGWLCAGGTLLLEIDPPEAPEVRALCGAAGLTGARVMQDLAGHDRIVVARATAEV
ncbi:MAG: peptide chain release factor N(5)-glutamine methyltransferase [Myxococcales bacterium]